jgi:GLPGLI family protein
MGVSQFKMNKIIYFLLLIITHSLYAQNLRISYDYKFVQDSLDVNNISNELVLLDITEKGSIFYSRPQYLNDSVAFYNNKTNTIQSKIDFSVKKDLSYTTYVNNQIGNVNYTFQEKDDLKWKILSEKKQILGYKVQKATLKFGGRNWIAWFSNDLPIQDGPYIFHGLPGLILSIEDEKKYHLFNVIGLEKREVPFEIEKLSSRSLKYI